MSGGSLVGIADRPDVLLSFAGAELLFHGLAVKPETDPGRSIEDKLVIGLPGHPVSALMMFNVISHQLFPAERLLYQCPADPNIASQPGRDDFSRFASAKPQANGRPAPFGEIRINEHIVPS